MSETTTETRTYLGFIGGLGGFDGYARLIIGKTHTGTPQPDGRVVIALPSEHGTSVTAEE